MMLPAPRKPTPVTTPWMMRVGSTLCPPPNAVTECAVRSTNNVEPMHTSVCVRSPAGLRPICRSHPTTVPSSVETSIGMRSCIHPPTRDRMASAAPGEDQLERAPRPHEAWQALRPAVARNDPEAHLGESHDRVLGCDAHVAGERQLAAAPEGVAVDRRDHRLARALERAHNALPEARDLLRAARIERRQL